MGDEYDMKNRKSTYIGIVIMLLSIPLIVYAREYNENEKEILEETSSEMISDVRILNTDGLVTSKEYTEREKEILEETGGEMKSDTRILNTDGIEFTEEYTFYDYYLETRTEEERRQREAKRVDLSDNESLERAKHRHTIYDEEPKNDYEREYFPVAKRRKIASLEKRQLENLMKEETDQDIRTQYQAEIDALSEEIYELMEDMKIIQEKYGIEED
jgi:hypothetical protein